MKSNEMLKQVKTLLGMEVKLEQMKLENGTVLEAEKFESGNEIFIVTEDERVALPIGEYEMENGMVVVIEEEGLIKEVKSSESEEAPEVEVEAEKEEKEEMGYATKEELAEVKSMIEEIKAMLDPKKEEELSEEVSEVKEELSSELPKEVLAELSQPAVEPINTNAEVVKQKVQFNIASKRTLSTMDRVMSKLNK
jgi:hypothetical protein